MVQKAGLTPEAMVEAPKLVEEGLSLEEFKTVLSLTDEAAKYWFNYFSPKKEEAPKLTPKAKKEE